MPLVIARVRVPSLVIGLLLVLTSSMHQLAWVSWLGVALIVVSLATTFMPGGYVKREPIPVQSPVQGRWIAVNSPADKVPSHGVHSAGQTYAIDLVYWPDASRTWKGVHRWPLCRRPEVFPGFGQPIFAPADGQVVRTRGGWRDHYSRNSWPALLYLFLEGSARELLGPGALLGNHVILDLGDGTYAALAHLKRRSIKVQKGESVRAGQLLAECGNSGNSSEPHIHFQLMDTSRTAFAAGLPFRFVGSDMPKNGEPLVAAVRLHDVRNRSQA
jgi:murein DD-endopeptidase MepM/ murein hydrolase activator NlpD